MTGRQYVLLRTTSNDSRTFERADTVPMAGSYTVSPSCRTRKEGPGNLGETVLMDGDGELAAGSVRSQEIQLGGPKRARRARNRRLKSSLAESESDDGGWSWGDLKVCLAALHRRRRPCRMLLSPLLCAEVARLP
ncbi:hypothetical protein SAMD00023353_0400740 [Rosellinia necatrix]|uniref:Uncharacterized protein n=1 Tax=Rosellinia necatrix TaxID=77044 RepID=A0A1S8A5K6_ROSNE|nr:hypothetical protein SAMD00023353_0400740 [Rosellinia necatrix]